MSGTKRDSLFPAGSIGRSQGPQFQRSASPTPSLTREPLTAHPLLSPTPSTSQVNTVPATTSETTHLSATPRYVPYTPRHRTAAATTGTTLQSSQPVAPQQQGGGATNKLQLMNLKASAQSIGLDTGSIGWEMLEKLVGEHDHTPEWNDIWSALTTGKGTLLLPLEQATHGNITPDFMKDHIVLCDGDSRDNASIVTLSGLRGTLTDTTLILRSSIQPGSSIFESLLTPTNRASALASLPPLPLVSSSPLSQTYPTFALESHTFTLSLPPHAASKPPLPPRPSQRPGTSPAGSRLSSSFASLFGKPSPSTTTSPLPSVTQPEAEHAVEVSAFSIDRRIIRKDVNKTVNKAIKAELKEALSMSGVPSWAIDHVHEFTAGLYPFVKGPQHGKGSFTTNGGSPTTPSYVIDPPKETSEELSQQFQDLYSGLEEEMRTVKSPITAKPRTSTFSDAEAEKEKEKDSVRHTAEDDRAKEILEAIERVVCSLFYDRLYLQPSSDDASHDKALSGRITALNKLDLGLEHLGVDVGKSGPDVDILLASCGETLSQLDQSACRCPADKAAILVAAHKILVDGLSRLPPIRLKSEAELENQSTPGTTTAGTPPPKEEDDTRPEKPTIEMPTETSVFLTPDGETPPPIVVSPDTDLPFELPSVTPLSDVPTDPLTPPPRVSSLPPPRATSPRLVVSPPPTPTPVSGDLILPLMIYAVVRANPQHLVSHLLFTQRFRNQSFGGEESYCLVNLMAVADFLENVDLKALGLGDSEKNVTSTANLTPIPVAQAALSPHSPTLPQGVPSRLRGRVEQQVDAIAGSANKVISGVVDSSFGVLRSFLPGTPDGQQQQNLDSDAASWNAVRPAFGLLRRESGFSIASLAASLPGRERAKSTTSAVGMPVEEGGQMMIEVSSRPGSIRSAYVSDEGESEEGSEEEEEDGEEEEEDEEDEVAGGHDTRSIRSFESMMAKSGKRRRHAKKRKTLSDRLASMPGLSKFATQPAVGSPPPSRRSSLLPVPNAVANRFDTPDSSRVASPTPMRIAPPHKRFMECSVDDLRVSEVGDLLMEYRRLAEGLKAIGGFDET